ncbi:MAG: hypothetical protein PUB32_01330 [Clostridiales bacterium]|nr:hypothetical protein [Clostridiales bacterium]
MFLIVKDKTPQFWISYVAGVIALAAVTFGGLITSKDTNQPSSYVFSTISSIYAVAVALVIIFFCVNLKLSVGWYAAIHLILFAAYLVGIITGHSGHSYITEQGAETRRQVIKARMDVERVVSLGASADDLPDDKRIIVKQALFEVEEKLRYSDPMQNPETAEQAHAVETALDALEQSVDDLLSGQADLSVVQQQAKLAIRKIDAYNRAKKLLK